MTDKSTLLRNLGAIGFSMHDLHLYLDTHPYDMEALSLFNKYKQKYEILVAEYERSYGPLTAVNAAMGDRWQWIDDPWPWEYAANAGVSASNAVNAVNAFKPEV
jgi:spore coat protein JB